MNNEIDVTSSSYTYMIRDLAQTEEGINKLREEWPLKKPYLDTLIRKTNEAKERKIYKTNIKTIDDLYNGGLYDELYVLGAEPGIGKTTLALQIADGLALNNNHVIYFSLEMSEDEMVIKSLSRLSYLKNVNVEQLDYSNIEPFTYNEFNDCCKNNSQDFNNLINTYKKTLYKKVNFVSCNEKKEHYTFKHVEVAISNYINSYNVTPVVIIDYLQLLELDEASNESNGVRLDTYEIIRQLKRFSKKYSALIIVISSLNRSSYRIGKKTQDDIGLDCFKESGGIEYTADNLLVILPQNNQTSTDDTMFLDLLILKNRHGRKNVKLPFVFNGAYSCYQELKD